MRNIRLHARFLCKKALILSSLGLIIGCTQSSSINLRPASEREALPRPKFVAQDETRSNAWPRFSQIRVYESVDDCRVPNCPLVWQVIVSEERSPREIAYGSLPSFGAMTIVAAEDLQPGREYILYVDNAPGAPKTGRGELHFYVDEQGIINASSEVD